MGRVVREDITTMRLVLEAAPEILNKYGIIVNQVPRELMLGLQKRENLAVFLTDLFMNIKEEKRTTNLHLLERVIELEAKNNILIELDQLDGLKDFLDVKVPTIKLTKDRAKDINISQFDELTASIGNFG